MIAATFCQRMKISGLRSFSSTARRLTCLLCLISGFLVGCGIEDSSNSATRVPWDNSRLQGSPEPPALYVAVEAFSGFSIERPVAIELEPDSGALLLLQNYLWREKRSSLSRYDPAEGGGEPVQLLELSEAAYSIAFHPDYKRNGFLYLGSNGPGEGGDSCSRVVRYTVNRNAPFGLIDDSALTIIEWPSDGHNGAAVCFGNDGMLYVTTGDGTSLMDLDEVGQNLASLKSKVLRLDVDGAEPRNAYAVPADNPFVGLANVRPETWAYGMRNPWRITNDPDTGQIWIGENGQDLVEYVQLLKRGANYGWSAYEGSRPFFLDRLSEPSPFTPPTIEHDHSVFRSLTGGFVYRGNRFPELVGAYIYGDYSTGRIWAAKHDGESLLWNREIADTTLAITGFGTSLDGDILIADHAGNAIYKLEPNPVGDDENLVFPTQLSKTGLFASVSDLKPAKGVLPYEINAPAWHDGAEVTRSLALPGNAQADYSTGSPYRVDWLSLKLPDGTAVMQTLTNPATKRRLETRVLLKQEKEWAAYSYLWNEKQDDAILIPKEGLKTKIDGLEWQVPSRSNCLVCHSRQADFVLSLTAAQLNRDVAYAGDMVNQMSLLNRIGILNTSSLNDRLGSIKTETFSDETKLVNPYDRGNPIDKRAHAYFTTNCSHCHRPNGGGNAKMDLSPWMDAEGQHLLNALPEHGNFGIENGRLITVGKPGLSILPVRVALRGAGQMPPVGTLYPDVQGIRLLLEWQLSLMEGTNESNGNK